MIQKKNERIKILSRSLNTLQYTTHICRLSFRFINLPYTILRSRMVKDYII